MNAPKPAAMLKAVERLKLDFFMLLDRQLLTERFLYLLLRPL